MRFFKLRLAIALSGIASLLNAYESLPNDKTKDYYLMNENYFVETSQGKIAIWDTKPQSECQTPTAIFIHGHCTNKNFFSQQFISPLFAKYRLVALDLPGYGKSNPPADPQKVYSFPGFADSVSEVVNVMKLENVIVIGWSLGGHVALELTSRLPQLRGLLITGTPPIEISAEGLSRGFQVANPKILECFGKGSLTYEEAELFATISGYNYSEEKKFIVDAVLQTDEGAKTIYPLSILKGVGQNELKIVSEWSLPIAVIAGEQDAGINNDYIIQEVKFKNLWRKKVHVIPNAGHAVFMEQPVEFNTILEQFFQEVFGN
jgi:pimeloyl-ACP methyl ester carboxylesterase